MNRHERRIAILGSTIAAACISACGKSSSTSPAASSTDPWTQVVGDGFGIPTQNTVPEFEVYNGYLYAATAATGSGLAKLYRSATGGAGAWTDVTPPLAGDISIHSFGVTALDGGYLWCGTGGGNGAMIFRTQDGVSWTAIAARGFGNPALTGTAPHMVVFQGTGDTQPYLYAAMGSHGAGELAQVWRTPYASTDAGSWSRLIDFATLDSGVTTVTYFYAWNNALYFGTNAGANLWKTTDGTNFSKTIDAGAGFGDTTNRVIASLEVFGSHLYATTNNPTKGGQIWRSADGTNWERVTEHAFGKGPAAFELRSIRASFGKLWATAYTDTALSAGTPVWRSSDGLTWTQSNTDGFGNPGNNGQNAVTIGFGDYQYFGGPNYDAGGQVWRAKMQ